MTRENAKQLMPILQAYADGKIIQCYINGVWVDFQTADFNQNADTYRIKPEPKLRAWRPEEVPVGRAVVKSKAFSPYYLILAATDRGFRVADIEGFHTYPYDYALENVEYSTDNGQTWAPCGVLAD